MSDTPHLTLPYLDAAQAQKHVTMNEALRALDVLVQTSIKDRDLSDPPASPAEGDTYLIAASATGSWAGHDNELAAFLDGAWIFHAPVPGLRIWVEDENRLYAWDGTQLVTVTPEPVQLQNMELLGINTTADTTNRLTVASDAVLFSHDGSDIQAKLNKSASGDTASILFQTNWSGRAEIGLVGDDDFRFKVSPDGSTFSTALTLEKTTGTPRVPSFDSRSLPDAGAAGAGAVIHVPDHITGPVMAFSDGTDWRKFDDGDAIIPGYPSASLVLDFVNNVAMLNGTSVAISSLLACTRAEAGWAESSNGSVSEFAANTLRVTDKGLLVFEPRTNKVQYSQAFDNAYWTKTTGVTVTANAAVSPAGDMTADRVSYDGTGSSGSYRIWKNVISAGSTVVGDPYVCSIWMKADTPTTVRIYGNGAGGGFVTCNLTTSWQRFETSGVGNGTSAVQLLVYSASGDNAPFDIYLWGAQVEEAAFAGPYIKTTGAEATASGDLVSVTDPSVFASQGTFLVEFNTAADWVDNGHSVLTPALNSTFFVYCDASNGNLYRYDGTTVTSAGAGSDNASYKLAVNYDGVNAARSSLDGAAVVAGSIMTQPADMYLGVKSSNSSHLNQYIKKLVYWPTVKTDAELVELTS